MGGGGDYLSSVRGSPGDVLKGSPGDCAKNVEYPLTFKWFWWRSHQNELQNQVLMLSEALFKSFRPITLRGYALWHSPPVIHNREYLVLMGFTRTWSEMSWYRCIFEISGARAIFKSWARSVTPRYTSKILRFLDPWCWGDYSEGSKLLQNI